MEQVLDAAIAIVEASGVDAMTMQAVANALGVGTMTLYGYVDSRDALIERCVDHMLADAPATPAPAEGADWVDTVVARCLTIRRWLVERPALVLLDAERPSLSERIAANYADEIAGLVRAGFCVDDAVVVRHAISTLLFGQIQWEEIHRTAGRTGVLSTNRARLRKLRAAPMVVEAVAAMERTDPETLFERSLRSLLDGFRPLLAGR